jgi:hypothetical protein
MIYSTCITKTIIIKNFFFMHIQIIIVSREFRHVCITKKLIFCVHNHVYY